jgi:dihydroxyacetone kinase-like predicted kinase
LELSESAAKKDGKTFWKTLKNINRPQSSPIPDFIMVDDNIINNSKDILKHITSFYHSLSTNTDKEANTFYRHSKANSTTQKLIKRKLDEYLSTEEIKVTPTQASLPCNSPITLPEVIQTLPKG